MHYLGDFRTRGHDGSYSGWRRPFEDAFCFAFVLAKYKWNSKLITSRQKFQKICLVHTADRKPTDASGRFDWPIAVTGATKGGREDCEEMGKVKGHWTVFNGLHKKILYSKICPSTRSVFESFFFSVHTCQCLFESAFFFHFGLLSTSIRWMQLFENATI